MADLGAMGVGRILEGARQSGDETSGQGQGRPYVAKCERRGGFNELYRAGSAFPVRARPGILSLEWRGLHEGGC